jgi:hypothetical protein
MPEQSQAAEHIRYSVKGDRISERDAELKAKEEELVAFRDAGILSEAELEEQMAQARWRIP